MAKNKGIYAPGELGRTRKNLGEVNEQEAKRVAKLLGGEVGVERPEPARPIPKPRSARGERKTTAASAGRSTQGPRSRPRSGERFPDRETAAGKPARSKTGNDGADDPRVPFRLGYWERVKMDRLAGEPEFEIKKFLQIFRSMLAIFGNIPDMVSPFFVKRRLDDYYDQIESLVTSVRVLFPRNNVRRNERLRKLSPFAFNILNTIRYWDIERIASEMSRIQVHPRSVTVGDLSDLLRAVYKPIFILEELDMEAHIKEAYKLLYRVLYTEDPVEAKERYQELIKISLNSLAVIRKSIRFRLYPLLLKLLSDRFLSYGEFFTERKNRFMAFLGVGEENQISPLDADFQTEEKRQEKKAAEDVTEDDEDDPEAAAKKAAKTAEKKAMGRGLQTLELLFPQAGWEKIASFPDFYPYFADIFDLRKNYELISPSDPLQQVVILLRILEELFFGLRSVAFGSIIGPDGKYEPISEVITSILNNWNRCVEVSLEKEYLPRLADYCRMLDISAETRHSTYAKRLLNELQWLRRLSLFPYYKFDSFTPPPVQKKEIPPLYPEIRHLRRYLTAIAAGIEEGNKNGGAETNAPCTGIKNPWEPYVFQVANPLSKRLDAILKNPKQRTNASLVFFTLAVTTVLDHIINNEHSWAYENMPDVLFRSAKGEGIIPLHNVDDKINTEAIFKRAPEDSGGGGAAPEAEEKQRPAPPPEQGPAAPAQTPPSGAL
ncbi:MAG: hypothetical protein LBU28_07300 [Spirochaetaceae bacterium]|jgi:hypothetical protein|nr:hypothetical protein [Spirochaetaceae bacterium]